MAALTCSDGFESSHPVDVAQSLALSYNWEFLRYGDDQISISIDGQWRTYSLTLAWYEDEEILRLISTFELRRAGHSIQHLDTCINRVNEQCWTGSFSYLSKDDLVMYRYGLILVGGQSPTFEQVDAMISNAVGDSERFYPTFQLSARGNVSIDEAMNVSMMEAVGTA